MHYAKVFGASLVKFVESMPRYPNLGQVVSDDGKRIRERRFRGYRVFYTAQADRLSILAIVHAARDFDVASSDLLGDE